MVSSDNVNVPAAAGGYSAATIDTDLRTSINMTLLRDGHVNKIQEHLLQSLNSHSADWPTLVQTHALALLRSGEATSFPALLRRVLDDVRTANAPATLAAALSSSTDNDNDDDAAAATADKQKDTPDSSAKKNGTPAGAGAGAAAANGGAQATTANASSEIDLALPRAVMQSALRVTRECLEDVVSVEEA
ncbi:hypothetical protein BROUX41_004068 [Berkeleyomyces rouxiae]|uniref:uncharacterized protein n=1 Tax=Berkeleyomyces rouxiae TaxID=2035830 RepID=UPI003B805402